MKVATQTRTNEPEVAAPANGNPIDNFPDDEHIGLGDGSLPGDDDAIPSNNSDDLILNPADPVPTADAFRCAKYHHVDHNRLVYSDGIYWRWNWQKYEPISEDEIKSQVYAFTRYAKKWAKQGDDAVFKPFAPNKSSVANIIDALKGVSFKPNKLDTWLSDDSELPPPCEVLACPNGLVWLRTDGAPRMFSKPTPLWFGPNCVEYNYNPHAPYPTAWFAFLKSIWDDDEESISLLQQWYGYNLTSSNAMEKILMMIGPKRSGKGTIAFVLQNMIGMDNCCEPTLSSLTQQFGLASLLGKRAACITDARLSTRADQAIIVERLLAISGGDIVEVARKFLPSVMMTSPPRFMLLTNELPKMLDPSGAMPSRFLFLKLRKSFYGQEDAGLRSKLLPELPAILNWSIEGWRRLQARGRFEQPKSAADCLTAMNDLASPISSFIRDCCNESGEELCGDVFWAWRSWCAEQGRQNPGNVASFGRDLKAAVAHVETKQHHYAPNPHNKSETKIGRFFDGISLTPAAKEAGSLMRAKHEREDNGM